MEDTKRKLNIIVFSGDFDKTMAAFTVACAAAGRNVDVTMFFTFWGVSIIKKQRLNSKTFIQKMFSWMMPVGPDNLGLSKMNFLGIGRSLLKTVIRQKDGMMPQDLLNLAKERKIHFIACEASLKMMGIQREELIDYNELRIGGPELLIDSINSGGLPLFI